MSTGWTAPGSTDESPWAQPGTGTDPAIGPSPQPTGGPTPSPQRELVQQIPLFPLRPLNVGEILGAAVRIYRARPKPVLGLAAAVYGVAFVLITLITGAGMIPMIGQMQATLENPSADPATFSVAGTVSEALATVGSTMITMVISTVAASMVTVVLTRIAVGEATGRSVPDGQIWTQLRRLALPAIGVSLIVAVASSLAFALPAALGALPLLILQEAGWLTIIALLVGLLLGALAALWVWARTILALPVLAIEEAGVLGSLRRSLSMTAGRRLWRVLGLALLVMVLYTVATQTVAGVVGFIAGIIYVVILLASMFEAIVLAVAVMTVLAMLGSYIATFLLAPFLCAGYAAIYADHRMRHEAWDVELNRQARQSHDPVAPGGLR